AGVRQGHVAGGQTTVLRCTLSATAGPNTLTATSGSLSGSPVTFTATGTAGTAATIAANSPTSQSAAAGTAVSTPPSVIVKDANGNPVAQVAVTFAVAPGNGTITGASQTTNARGVATVGSWTLSATAGPNTLTATSTGLSGSPVTFSATGTAGTAATIAANSPTSQTATVGTAVNTPPSVIVKDANGNPVAQVAVTFAVAPGNGSITGASQTTNASGVATVGSWTLSATAGSNTLTASSGSLSGSPVTFTATGTAGAAATIAANSPTSQSASAGTAVTSPPSVIVKDANGNPVAEVAVTFTPAAGSGSVTGGTQTTNGSGIATVGSWTLSATAGSNTLTATSGSLTGSPVTFTATGTAGAAATIAANSPTSQSAAAGTAVSTPPSAIVKDANGNPVAQVAVPFVVAPGNGTITGASQTTNGSGVAPVGSSTPTARAGDLTLTATSGSLSGSPVTFTATGTAGTAATIAANSATSQSATVGTAVGSPPSVIVKDANGNPVAQVAVTFAVAPGNGTITGASQTTNASGVATVGSWTLSATAGLNTLTATSTGLSDSPVTFTATGTAGGAGTIAAKSATSQSATAGTAACTTPLGTVKDANGNPVAEVAVTFTPAAGSGSVTGGTQTTNGSGIATVGSWTLSATAGSNTLTATSGSLTGSPVTFTATGTAGAAATIAANSPTSQSAPAGTVVGSPPSVIIKDANGNPVAGVAVTFAVAPGNGTITVGNETTKASGGATVGGR